MMEKLDTCGFTLHDVIENSLYWFIFESSTANEKTPTPGGPTDGCLHGWAELQSEDDSFLSIW